MLACGVVVDVAAVGGKDAEARGDETRHGVVVREVDTRMDDDDADARLLGRRATSRWRGSAGGRRCAAPATWSAPVRRTPEPERHARPVGLREEDHAAAERVTVGAESATASAGTRSPAPRYRKSQEPCYSSPSLSRRRSHGEHDHPRQVPSVLKDKKAFATWPP